MNLDTLYKEACQNNKNAEKRLFNHLSASFRLFILRRVSNKEDADDILQNVLAVIEMKYHDIVITKSFSAWAYEILKKQILAYYKDKKLPRNQNVVLDENVLSAYKIDELLIKKKLLICLGKLNNLNKTHARILNLYYLGFTTDEICQKLGISHSNFYASLHRARKMLSRCLEEGEF